MCQFWQALEQFWGLSSPRLNWQLRFGEAAFAQQDFLVPTQQLATILPVAGTPHEWLEISEFEEGVYLGYNEKSEEYAPVDPRDLICYEFSVPALGRVLGERVGFSPSIEILPDAQHCFLLGRYGGTLGASFGFYFAKVSDPRRLRECLNAIQLKDQQPYVIFLTSVRMLSGESSRVLIDKGCLCLPLEQSLISEEEGWAVTDWARKQLVEFRDRLLPKPQASLGKFPTPPGCSWQDVEIRFHDSHTVTVLAGGHHERLMFSQMGLANAKNGLPNMQWELLRTMAQNHGVLTWKLPGARRENRKHREFLNKKLRSFFGIEGEPIELTDDKKGYRCAFNLVPDYSWSVP